MFFKNGIIGWGWFRWFRKPNLHLWLKVAQGLEVEHTKGLCPANMYSFYTNLVEAYNLHDYAPNAYGIATNLVFKLVEMVGCLF